MSALLARLSPTVGDDFIDPSLLFLEKEVLHVDHNYNLEHPELPQSDLAFPDKLNFIVATLQALGSDVVALQEVLDLNALQDLANGLGFLRFAATPDGRGNRVAFLTRNALAGPAQEINQFRLAPGVVVQDFGTGGAVEVLLQLPRPALQITVAHNGGQIDVVNTHLKSKLLTFGPNFSTSDETLRARTAYFALQRRAAEATSLREHATGSFRQVGDVVVLGDLNDGPEAATTEIFYGPPGSQPRGPIDATHVTGAFQRPDNEDGRRLFNVVKLVPRGDPLVEAAQRPKRTPGSHLV